MQSVLKEGGDDENSSALDENKNPLPSGEGLSDGDGTSR